MKFNISSQKFEFIESKFTELVTPDIKIETLGSDIVKNFKNEFINIFKNKRARIKANILRFKKTCQSHEIDEKLSEWYSEVSIIQIEKSKKAVVNLKIKIEKKLCYGESDEIELENITADDDDEVLIF